MVHHLFLYFGLTCCLQLFMELKAPQNPKPITWLFGLIVWHKSCITLSAFLIQIEPGRWEGKKVCILRRKYGPRSLGQTVNPPSQTVAGSALNIVGIAQISCVPSQIPHSGGASFCAISNTGHSVICTKSVLNTLSACAITRVVEIFFGIVAEALTQL